jgi:cytochrome c
MPLRLEYALLPTLLPAALGFVFGLVPIQASAQDAAAGQRVFGQCRACHVNAQGAKSTIGPNLFGVVGRTAGTVDGFRYSAQMKEKGAGGLVWTPETLAPYVTNPKQVVPAGTMAFPGLKNEQQVADVIAYLQTVK